jgi:hypothetical protein
MSIEVCPHGSNKAPIYLPSFKISTTRKTDRNIALQAIWRQQKTLHKQRFELLQLQKTELAA